MYDENFKNWQSELNQYTKVREIEEAASYADFATALLISFGVILFFGAGTYLLFTGLVASLLAVIS